MKGIKYIFFILLILAFGYGVIGQMVLPPDHVEENDLCEEYQGEWYRIEDDGTRSLIEMPGRYEKGTERQRFLKIWMGESAISVFGDRIFVPIWMENRFMSIRPMEKDGLGRQVRNVIL